MTPWFSYVDKRWVLAGLVLLAGCVQEDERMVSRNATHITYEWGGGNFTGLFYDELGPAMKWLEYNSFPDEKVLCWWDYGHMVRATGRETLVWEPSREILYTVSKYAAMNKEKLAEVECDCSPHYKIADVVAAFTTTDPSWLGEIMYKYEFDYVLAAEQDVSKSWAMLMIAGKDPMAYLTGDFDVTELGRQMTIIKMVSADEIEGFELVYADRFAKIYKKE